MKLLAIISILLSLVPQGIGGKAGIGAKGGIGGGPSLWTQIQAPSNITCSGSAAGASACTVTASSTVAGDGLALIETAFANCGSCVAGAVYTSASGDSSWSHCSSANGSVQVGSSPNRFYTTDCAYILSATGGATSLSITLTFPVGTTAWTESVVAVEFRKRTGSIVFDAAGTATTSASCTACTSPAITLSGSNDYVFQWLGVGQVPLSILNPAYINPIILDPNNVGAAWAGALNQTAAGAQTWSQAPAGGAVMSGIAFK